MDVVPAELLNEHQALLKAICYRMLGDEAEAEDVVQETFLRAMLRPVEVDRLRPWLVRVARNLAIDLLRRRRFIDVEPLDADAGAADPGPLFDPESEGSMRQDKNAAVLYAITHLSASQRAIVFLRDLLDLSVHETAQVVGMGENSVKVVHMRARQRLEASRDLPLVVDEAALDALDEFATWLAAREVLGVAVRPEGTGSGPDPGLAPGVLLAHRRLLDALVELARDGDRPTLLARTLLCRASATMAQGRHSDTIADLEEAAELSRPVPALHVQALYRLALACAETAADPARGRDLALQALALPEVAGTALEASLWTALASARFYLGDVEGAHDAHRRGLDVVLAQPTLRDQLVRHHNDGARLTHDGRWLDALPVLERALDLAILVGDRRYEAMIANNLGLVHRCLRDAEAAGTWFRRALALGRELGTTGHPLANLGWLEQDLRHHASAEGLFEAAISAHQAVGNRRSEALVRLALGILTHQRGEPIRAVERLQASVDELEDLGYTYAIGIALGHLAAAKAVAGQADARDVFAAALARAQDEDAGALRALEGVLFATEGRTADAWARLAEADRADADVRNAVQLLERLLAAPEFTAA